MTPLKRNLLANFLGLGWVVVIQLVCVPLFVRAMGLESYALVGFFLTLQASLQVLDLGVGTTMNRELARASKRPEQAAELRDFVRTFDIGYWAIGVLLGVGIAVLAPVIATRWVQAQSLSVERVTTAVRMMSVRAPVAPGAGRAAGASAPRATERGAR